MVLLVGCVAPVSRREQARDCLHCGFWRPTRSSQSLCGSDAVSSWPLGEFLLSERHLTESVPIVTGLPGRGTGSMFCLHPLGRRLGYQAARFGTGDFEGYTFSPQPEGRMVVVIPRSVGVQGCARYLYQRCGSERCVEAVGRYEAQAARCP